MSVERGRTRSIANTVDYWLDTAGLTRGVGATTTLPDTAPADGCLLIRTDFGTAPFPVAYIEMDGGGHSVPNPNPPSRTPQSAALSGRVCEDAHRIDLAWDFLSSH